MEKDNYKALAIAGMVFLIIAMVVSVVIITVQEKQIVGLKKTIAEQNITINSDLICEKLCTPGFNSGEYDAYKVRDGICNCFKNGEIVNAEQIK